MISGNERYKRLPLCSDCRNKKKKKVEEAIPLSSVDELLKLVGPKK